MAKLFVRSLDSLLTSLPDRLVDVVQREAAIGLPDHFGAFFERELWAEFNRVRRELSETASIELQLAEYRTAAAEAANLRPAGGLALDRTRL